MFESQQWTEIYVLFQNSRPILGLTQPPTEWVKSVLPPEVKWPGFEAANSPPSSVGIKNMWCFTFYPPLPHCNNHENGKYIYIYSLFIYLFSLWPAAQRGPRPPHPSGFLITHNDALVGRTPLDEWSARRRDLYLTTHNTHNRQTSMPPVGFEPTISAGERLQTYALDRAATGTGYGKYITI